jgi:prevent-host-death family protein
VPTIPQNQLRNHSGEVLRRAQAGEEFTITVSGRPVAHLGPIAPAQWVRLGDLGELWALPKDPSFARDIADLGGELRDPFAKD